MSLRRADNLPRGVLLSVVCLSETAKPPSSGGLAHWEAVGVWKTKNEYTRQCETNKVQYKENSKRRLSCSCDLGKRLTVSARILVAIATFRNAAITVVLTPCVLCN
jgi:hypothetical protein